MLQSGRNSNDQVCGFSRNTRGHDLQPRTLGVVVVVVVVVVVMEDWDSTFNVNDCAIVVVDRTVAAALKASWNERKVRTIGAVNVVNVGHVKGVVTGLE